MRERIEKCKSDNPLWGYKRIATFLKIGVSTVRYHLCEKERDKCNQRMKKFRKKNPLLVKIARYCTPRNRGSGNPFLSIKEVEAVARKSPICYLSGKQIDLDNPDSYSFDHKIPFSRGGECSIENLGITTPVINRCKSDLTPEEFLSLCKEILEYNGFKVTKW